MSQIASNLGFDQPEGKNCRGFQRLVTFDKWTDS